MEFHALSRRELQALCKRNAIRANMSNAAMAEALHSLPSVDGIDEIGRAAPPAMAAVKSPPEEEEERALEIPVPRGVRVLGRTRTAAASKESEDVPGRNTLQGCRRTAAREEGAAPAAVEAGEAVAEEGQGHGCPLPRGGGARGNTRKAAARKTEEAVPRNQGTEAPVDVEGVATGRRRTRRSTRSNAKADLDKKDEVSAAAQEEQKVLVSVSAKDEVVAMLEEGKKVTRMSTVCKAQEVQQGNTTVELVEEDQAATTKRRRRRRRSARTKVVLVAAGTGQKADSSDATIGSAVLGYDQSCGHPEEEQVVAVVEEGAKKLKEVLGYDHSCGHPEEEQVVAVVEEGAKKLKEGTKKGQDQINTVHNPASLVEEEDSPITSARCKVNAANVSYRALVAGEEVVKDDSFTLTGEGDQSNLLVNPLDRFAKPTNEFTIKAEKKNSECWWMLM